MREPSDGSGEAAAAHRDDPAAGEPLAAAGLRSPAAPSRRRLLGGAAGMAASQLAVPWTANAQSGPAAPDAPRKREPRTSFASLKQIRTGNLDIGYAEEGPASGPPVLLLHGWPYDIHSYIDVAPILADAGFRVVVPYLRGYGSTRFLSGDAPRNGQQAALAMDALELIDALQLKDVILGGFDWGARTADIVAALWPERCRALVSVSGYLIGSQAANAKPLPPRAELQWWYQYYFATDRGQAGYAGYTHEFARLIWELASPNWAFDDATFERSAQAFDNPDHVPIVVNNYRWRLGLAEGEPRYNEIERKLAGQPTIALPTITLEGDANGAPHPDPDAYAKRFTGRYQHRLIEGGIGHNLPQEAPEAFAQAVLDVAKF